MGADRWYVAGSASEGSLKLEITSIERVAYLPMWLGVKPSSVGIPHKQDWIVFLTEVEIVAINHERRRFVNVVTRRSTDARLERKHRDIRCPNRHVSIRGGRDTKPTQPRWFQKRKRLNRRGVLTIQGSSAHGSAIRSVIHSLLESKL